MMLNVTNYKLIKMFLKYESLGGNIKIKYQKTKHFKLQLKLVILGKVERSSTSPQGSPYESPAGTSSAHFFSWLRIPFLSHCTTFISFGIGISARPDLPHPVH